MLQVGDGIARVHGLENCVALEMLEFEHGVVGIAFNLEEDNVGVALFGEWEQVKEGEPVRRTGSVAQRPRRRRACSAASSTRSGSPLDGGRRDRDDRAPPARVQGAGRRRAPAGEGAAPDRHQGDRLDDERRPRPARADHRRPRHRQDRDRDRHDPQPARHGRDLHLRRDRPEGLDRRAGVRAPARRGRDGLHDHRLGRRARGGADQVDGPVRRRRDGRALPLQRASTRSSSTTTSRSTRTRTASSRCCCAARRAARPTRATSSTCTRGCSSARAS